ncbi:MAG: PaaI family thioesterase [Jatrophihabitans sp.]
MTSLDDVLAAVPFVATLGITIDSARKDEVVGRMPYARERTTIGGAVNGGALMALADNVGGVCAFLNLPPNSGTSTTSSSTTFVRGARGEVVATSRPLHVGRTTIAVVTEIRDDQGRLVAQTTQSQAVLQQRA